jgi:hypothetical protein
MTGQLSSPEIYWDEIDKLWKGGWVGICCYFFNIRTERAGYLARMEGMINAYKFIF